MKKIFAFLISILPIIAYSQINNTFEGVTLNIPCSLEYKGLIINQKSYNCIYQDNNDKIHSFDFNISDLSKDYNKINKSQFNTFKKTFLQTVYSSKVDGEISEYITINGVSAVSKFSYMYYENIKLIVVTICFLHSTNSIMISHATNILNKEIVIEDLKKRIKF